MQVRPGWDIPLNFVIFSFFFTSILSLINIGSSIAFNSISSLATGALLLSYIVSTACLLWRKLAHKRMWIPFDNHKHNCANIAATALLKSHWNLGWFGTLLNVWAIAALIMMFIFGFFPTAPNLDATGLNWSFVIFIGVGNS
jgi:choline transport protein